MSKVKENNCTCLQCGIQFYVKEYRIKHGGGKYCSKECADKSKRKVKENNCTCLICGNRFYRNPSQIACGSNKYCSKECVDKSKRNGVKRNCLVCHKPFYAKPHQIIRGHGRFCSMKCWHVFNRGDNHSQWNAEMTDEERAIRNGSKRDLPEYKNWRRNVFTRDNYTCRACGAIGVRLNAHHVIPWSVDVSLRYEISNGITLCKSCHKKEHKRLKKLKEFQRDLFIS